MMNKLIAEILVLTAVGSAFLSGCTTYQVFPFVARPGDTVSMSIGSPLNLSRADITSVTFTYDSGQVGTGSVDLTPNLRAVFRLFADKASDVYSPGGGWTEEIPVNFLVKSGGHEPSATVVVLDLPTTMLEGSGVVTIQTDTSKVSYPTINSPIEDISIELSIITAAGIGAPNPFEYEIGIGAVNTSNLSRLEPVERITVNPPFQPYTYGPDPSTYATVGAIQMQLDLSTCNNGSVPLTNDDYRLVVDDMSVLTNSRRSVLSSADSTTADILNVAFVSTEAKLKYFEPRFDVILKNGIKPGCNPWFYNQDWTDEDTIKYFDIDGNIEANAPPQPPETKPSSRGDQSTEYWVEVTQ